VRVDAHRGKRFRRVNQVHSLRKSAHREHVDAFDYRSLARIRFRHHHGLDLVLACRQRRREGSANRAHLAVQREFSEKNILIEPLAKERALAAQNRKRHGQIERRAFLSDVGGRQIDRDAQNREIMAAIFQRGLDAFAALLDSHVRQAHHIKIPGPPRADVHLDFDQIGVDAKHRGAECFEVHVSTNVTTHSSRKSNANVSINLVLGLTTLFGPVLCVIFRHIERARCFTGPEGAPIVD
jgi:hypothetical protein